MQTPSEQSHSPNSETRTREWTARTNTPKRSVFGNYRNDDSRCDGHEAVPTSSAAAVAATPIPNLRAAIDQAVARAFIHRYLAQAFADPTPESWQWLTAAPTTANLRSASQVLDSSLAAAMEALVATFQSGAFKSFLNAYLAEFGHAARGSCPLNEIEYGDLKTDPLFQPHRLADLAAFYRAFGLEVAEDAGERHDHICLQLEFMCVLAAQEAYALGHQLDADERALGHNAQKQFLRDHLGRWIPAFTRRLAAATGESTLRELATFTRIFVETECVRFGVNPGSEDLLLRPVDEASEQMCAGCGLNRLPPGAQESTAIP